MILIICLQPSGFKFKSDSICNLVNYFLLLIDRNQGAKNHFDAHALITTTL